MTLILSNEDVRKVLTMDITMKALERAYMDLATQEAVCRPRIDIQIPTMDTKKLYQWGTMEGGSTAGYFAIRMKSDIVFEQEYKGTRTQEKYCVRQGKFCGLVLLTSIENGEPLALINDGYLQHMRVGADSGIGVKHMAKANSEVVGMIGSGGMAMHHVEAFTLVRGIKRVQIYSPNKGHRERFAKEIREKYGIEGVPVNHPKEAYQEADIIAGCTDSTEAVIIGEWLPKGSHITCVGGKSDEEAIRRIDISLRFGNAPGPWGLPEMALADEFLTYAAEPERDTGLRMKRAGKRGHGATAGDRVVFLNELLEGKKKGRSSAKQITHSERGNIQGAQFFAVAGKAYELAKERGLGRELPTDWLLQDIRD